MPQPPETSGLDLQSALLVAALHIAGSIAVFLIGRWLARLARHWTRRVLARTPVTASITQLAERGVYYGTLILAFCIALAILGVPVNIIVAAVAFVLIIAAVALRETLGDFAAAVIFILFQPFKVGDLIETNGLVGRVQELLMFSTVLITLDNRKLFIPNGTIQNSNLTNYSALDTIRLDLPVSVSYADDLGRAREALLVIAQADARVLHEPPPVVDVMELGTSGVGLMLRVHARSSDFWALRPALNEQIKLGFDRQRLTIPFPQLDLHLAAELDKRMQGAVEVAPTEATPTQSA